MRASAVILHFRRRLRRPVPWVVTGVFWGIFTCYSFLIFSQFHGSRALLALHAVLMPGIISFCYGFLCPLPWRYTGDSRTWAGFLRGSFQAVLLNSLLVAVITALSLGILRAAHAPIVDFGFTGGHPERYLYQLRAQMVFAVPLMTVIGGVIYLGESSEEEKNEALDQLQEAQWVLLRGQLSPHVLFNALNGLAELVHQDADKAEAALLDLSGLYRALLDHGDKVRAPMGDERRLVERYLNVELMRLGERLKVSWDWDEALDGFQAPPFLAQPLVENALKHGISPSPSGGELRLRFKKELYGTVLRVSNTGVPPRLVLGSGIGLANLEARLRLAYKGRAGFRLFSEGDWTVAEITLPEEAR